MEAGIGIITVPPVSSNVKRVLASTADKIAKHPKNKLRRVIRLGICFVMNDIFRDTIFCDALMLQSHLP